MISSTSRQASGAVDNIRPPPAISGAGRQRTQANWSTPAMTGPRKREPIAAKSAGLPVVTKRCWGAGRSSGRSRPALGQYAVDVLGALLRAADEGDVVTHHVRDDAGQQRVVGAAEDQGVDAGLDQRVEVLVGGGQQLRTRRHAGLDEVHETRAGLGQQLGPAERRRTRPRRPGTSPSPSCRSRRRAGSGSRRRPGGRRAGSPRPPVRRTARGRRGASRRWPSCRR